jgi:hypothetical protein
VKTLINDNNEREINTTSILNGDNIRYGSPPTGNTGVIVSPPKKKFLIRSQSHTEPTSPIPNNNNFSQSQKMNNDNSILNTQNGLDDENSMDDSVNNQFASITHTNETNFNNNQQFKSTINNGNEQHINLQLRTDQNSIPQRIIKQQPIVMNNNNNNNKRTFQQPNLGKNLYSI